MHHDSQNNSYEGYSYSHPSISTSSQNTYYQYYNPRRRTRQFRYSNGTTTTGYNFSHLQQQYQPSVGISDLAEPMSLFDDLRFPLNRPSDVIPFPVVYTPSNPSRRIPPIPDERLATASAMRERLLNDIQQSMREIDRELTSLEQRSTFSQYIPSRPLPLVAPRRKSLDKGLAITNDNNDPSRQSKPRKVYNVIPRIPSQPKKTATPTSVSNLIEETTSQLFFSQYHYAAEVEEITIDEKDAENAEMKSVANEIPHSKSSEPLSLDPFRREQSALSEHRALILVREYIDDEQTETTEDFQHNDPVDTDTAQLSLVRSSTQTGTSNKLNIQDFKALTHTAPEPAVVIPSLPVSELKPKEIPDKTETDLINTMLSKPVKHAHLSTKPEETLSSSRQAIVNPKNNTDVDTGYFFSDFGEGGEGEEDLISIDPRHFQIPTDTELLPEDNISNILIRQSQTSLRNPHSFQQQQQQQQYERKLITRNNNKHVEETESEKIHSSTKHIITSSSAASSKKLFPISIYDSMQTQLTNKNTNMNEHRHDDVRPPLTTSRSNRTEQSDENEFNHFVTSTRRTSLRNKDTPQQRSASPPRSPQHPVVYALSRDTSLSPSDILKSTEYIDDSGDLRSSQSPSNTPLPIALKSPDVTTNRPTSTSSRPMTPERRDSIPTLDQNTLLTSADLRDLDERNDEHSDDNPSSPLENFIFIPKNPSNETERENDEEQYRMPSPFILEQEDRRLTSVSPTDIETRESEEKFFDLPPLIIDRQETNRTPQSESKPKLIPKDERDEQPLLTESQKRSKLSLIIQPPKPKQKKPIDPPKPVSIPPT